MEGLLSSLERVRKLVGRAGPWIKHGRTGTLSPGCDGAAKLLWLLIVKK